MENSLNNQSVPIQITGRNIKLTDAIRNMVNEKFEKLERHFNHMTRIHVTLKVDKVDREPKSKDGVRKLQTAKALISLPSHHEIIAEESTDDLYSSIDLLVANLDRQLKSFKEMLQSKNSLRT